MAEARRRWAELLDAVDGGDEVTVTRRGRPVARILSPAAYDLLIRGRPDVWVAIEGHLQSRDEPAPDGWDEGLRDRSPGRGAPFEDE